MFLAGTLDAILELAPIVRELFGHFVGSARGRRLIKCAKDSGHYRRVAAYDGPKVYDLTDVEFM
jgi:hypothetical protein